MPNLARESWRQCIAIVPAMALLVAPFETHMRLILVWNVFAALYVLLTWLAFWKASPQQLVEVTLANRPARWERAMLGGPQQLAQAAALGAFFIAGLALPRAEAIGPAPLVITAGIIAIVGSWFVLHIGFATHYLWLYAESGGLEFPGEESSPTFSDLTYFAFSVGTSFGTTDVVVTNRRLRKAVQVHGLLSFFFNVVLLALTITVVASYSAGQ